MFVVIDGQGKKIGPTTMRSGDALDAAVKKQIRSLLPSKKERREKWKEMKDKGCQLIVTPNVADKRRAEGTSA